MVMFRVIPGKELLGKAAAILNATKTIWKIRAILQGRKLRFRELVVIARIRPAVGLRDPQV